MDFNENMFELGNKGSAIRELFEYGKKRKAEIGENNVFDFSIGNPSVEPPKEVSDSLINLLKDKNPNEIHGYTSALGDNDARNSIRDFLNKKYNANIDSNLIYLTCGAAASLTISLNAILNLGDEVIVFAPYFPEYKVFIEKACGKVIEVPVDMNDFQINFDILEKAINNKTKAIIVNSPNNPTGALFTKETIEKLSSFLNNKEKEFNHTIFLISDEPYRELIYEDIEYPFITNFYDDSIICYSFSKSLSLPGDRIGYMVLSSNCKNNANVFKAICGAGRALGFVCAPSLFQHLIPYCVDKTSDISIYKKNRDILYNMLKKIGYEIVYPDGAFYMFVKALEDSSINFSKRALDYELLLVPSDSFGLPGFVRISYCVKTDLIERSKDAFTKLFTSYNK